MYIYIYTYILIYIIYTKGKEGFAKISKNLARYRSENNFVDYQNNYVGHLNCLLDTERIFSWSLKYGSSETLYFKEFYVNFSHLLINYNKI